MIKFSGLKDEEIKKIIATAELAKEESGINKLVAEIFEEFDKDKNGVLDRKEIRSFFSKIFKEWKLTIPMTDEFLDDLFRDIDKDHNNKISPDEMKLYLQAYLSHLVPVLAKELEARTVKVSAVPAKK